MQDDRTFEKHSRRMEAGLAGSGTMFAVWGICQLLFYSGAELVDQKAPIIGPTFIAAGALLVYAFREGIVRQLRTKAVAEIRRRRLSVATSGVLSPLMDSVLDGSRW